MRLIRSPRFRGPASLAAWRPRPPARSSGDCGGGGDGGSGGPIAGPSIGLAPSSYAGEAVHPRAREELPALLDRRTYLWYQDFRGCPRPRSTRPPTPPAGLFRGPEMPPTTASGKAKDNSTSTYDRGLDPRGRNLASRTVRLPDRAAVASPPRRAIVAFTGPGRRPRRTGSARRRDRQVDGIDCRERRRRRGPQRRVLSTAAVSHTFTIRDFRGRRDAQRHHDLRSS